MSNFDYNCYIGRWPFSKSRNADFDCLVKIHEAHGITHGFVSSLESILCNDPMEENLQLAAMLKSTDYDIVPSFNPLLPNIERDFRISDESFDYKAVRVYPTIHGYDYDSMELEHLITIAVERNKAVFIQTTFGDIRMDYLMKQKPADIMKISGLIKKAEGTRIVFCNLRINEIRQLGDVFRNSDDIYFDMSELKHSMFAIEDIVTEGLEGKMVFGSFYPMFDFSGAYIHFKGTTHSTRDKILGKNIFERGTL